MKFDSGTVEPHLQKRPLKRPKKMFGDLKITGEVHWEMHFWESEMVVT